MGFPWGLVAVLGLYVVAVVGYLAWAHWTSPEYQSAQHEAFANELLGPTDGREVEPRFLFQAYGELAEAARLLPHERALHERMEGLHRLMELRRLKLPPELAVRGQAVGMLYAQHLEREQDYVRSLARGVRLTPEQILATPRKVALWATIFGLLLAVVGAYLHVTGKSVRFLDRERWQAQQEAELEGLGEFRRGLPGAPQAFTRTRRSRPPSARCAPGGRRSRASRVSRRDDRGLRGIRPQRIAGCRPRRRSHPCRAGAAGRRSSRRGRRSSGASPRPGARGGTPDARARTARALLVLGAVQGAGGVDEAPSRPHAASAGLEERGLDLHVLARGPRARRRQRRSGPRRRVPSSEQGASTSTRS